jgi:hypothetical protein
MSHIFSDDPSEILESASLLAHLAQRGLAREHDRRASSAEPGIVVGSFRTDNAADGHEESRRQDKALVSLVYSG